MRMIHSRKEKFTGKISTKFPIEALLGFHKMRFKHSILLKLLGLIRYSHKFRGIKITNLTLLFIMVSKLTVLAKSVYNIFLAIVLTKLKIFFCNTSPKDILIVSSEKT